MHWIAIGLTCETERTGDRTELFTEMSKYDII